MSYPINSLKIDLSCKVLESKKLDKEQKLSLIEFIETANDTQTQYLALTGIVRESFTEKEITNIKEQYLNSNIKESEEIHNAIMATKLLAMAVIAGVAVYKRFFSQAAKECNHKSGADKTACMRKYKRLALEKQIAEIKKSIPKCSKSVNPMRCKELFQKKLQKLEAQKV